jgi:carbonic anhydrase
MDFFESIIERNAQFAETNFLPDLKMLPSTGTIIVGCVDPRVDPVEVLGVKQGEAVVIRNVGGRVNRPLMETIAILRVVAKAAGREGGVRNLVLLHHTDCGIISCYHHAPELLAKSFEVDAASLDALEILDPYKSILRDVATLRADEQLPDRLVIVGVVYDVKTGRLETIVPPAPLRGGN